MTSVEERVSWGKAMLTKKRKKERERERERTKKRERERDIDITPKTIITSNSRRTRHVSNN